MIPQQDILELLNQAQKSLPEEKRRPFIERATSRIGSFLQENQNALIGGALGWLLGEALDNVPIVKHLTGDHASTLGAALGAWVGHSKDKEEAVKRAGVARIVDEELQNARRS